jgi:GWxTD domain-containing protein
MLLCGAAAEAARSKDPALRDWLDGPVHYIITPAEVKEYKALETDAERVAFTERFWRRRDPTPDTLSNEYRQLLWTRVKEANEKFVDSSKPGWMTDRGKIYILYGPPDEVKEDPNARVASKDTDGAGLIRWVYLKPGGRVDVDPVVFVPFVRDLSGEYRISHDPGLASPFFSFNDIDNRRTAGLPDFAAQAPAGNRSPLGVMLDLGRMQEVPPQEKFLIDTVETIETFAYQPLPLALDRFRAGREGFLTVITVSIPESAEGVPPALVARFARVGGGAGPHLLGEGSFRIEGDGIGRIAQGRVPLEPGAWDLTVLAVDQATGVSRIYRGRIDPLPSGAQLSVSDTVLARVMEPLPYAAQSSYDAPYIVGGFHVVPRVGEVVVRGEPVRFFFEVYGGAPPYRLTYQLEGREDDGRWRALGRPHEREGTTIGQGFELPTAASWPVGAYRLRVRVTDTAAQAVETHATFSVALAESTPEATAPQPIISRPD